MAKVITFGEIMLRLAPEGYYRFFQNDRMHATFGGGEANVAVSLAHYGIDTAFVTRLPSHAIGQGAVDSLRRYGVDVSRIIRGGERVGIYFLEKGASQRGSVCITTEIIQRFRMPARRNLTGTAFLTEQTGSTLPGSLRRWERMSGRSAGKHARLRRRKE